jgi:CubicO group peptidase (beta-lactamase class C family)
MFTGVVVSHLLNENKLSLETPINMYLEDVLTEESKSKFAEITLAHLMQHKAGIPTYGSSVYLKAKEGGQFYWNKGYSKEEFIKDLNQVDLEFEPGSQQSYSNSGYNIVGLILEEVTGKAYKELVRIYITERLEMKSTFIKPTKNEEKSIVIPYPPSSPHRASKFSDWGYATPASGIFSSVDDLLKLMNKQLEAYRTRENSEDISPYVLTNRPGLDNEMEFNYGLGFFERKGPNGEVLFQHDGDADGYTIFYTIDPSKNLGKVLITSSGGDWFLELDNKIEEKIFDWFEEVE